jgi:hypothetical protein
VEFPWAKHEAALENDDTYRAAWNRTGRINDNSPSGWDMSLASIAARSGFTDDEIVTVLVGARRRHGDPIKHDGYYRTTVGTARVGARPPAELNAQKDDGTREDRIAVIAHDLEFPVTDIQRVTGEPPIYRFVLRDDEAGRERSVEIPAPQLLDQRTFRKQIFSLTNIPPKSIDSKRAPTWDDYVREIAAVAQEFDAGEDATVSGELKALLEDYFAANRPVPVPAGQLVEQPGHPFTRDGKAWFKLSGLTRYANTVLGSKTPRASLIQRLRVAGGEVRVIACQNAHDRKKTTTGRFYGVPWVTEDEAEAKEEEQHE